MNRAMKLYITIAAILLTCTLTNAQQVDVQVVYNNTADIKANTETINKIKSAVKTTELQTALNGNGHITDKNLIIRVAFFDRGVIGQLKLKAEHELTPEKYIEEWQKTVINKSGILFLFVKGKDGSQYALHKMVVSQQLENEHLFPLVTEFINENLSGDFSTVVGNGTKYLAKAIIPVWDVDTEDNRGIQNKAKSLAENERYWENRINFFHNSWKSTFLDLKPIPRNAAMQNLSRIFLLKSGTTDTIKTQIPIYADNTIFKGNNVEVEGEDYFFDFTAKYLPYFLKKEPVTLLEISDTRSNSFGDEYKTYLFPLISTIENSNRFNDLLMISEWDLEKGSNPLSFTIKNSSNLRDKVSDDKLELILRNLNTEFNEGDPIPVIHPWYPRTFCNVYASDLARTYLFPGLFSSGSNYAPWGKHQGAAYLHEECKDNKNGKFKNLSLDEAWKYTNAGFLVYLTAYNWRYYAGKTTKKYNYSGHIATCFPTNGYSGNYLNANIIQAGVGEAGVKEFSKCGSSFTSNASANVYLGYILK